MEILGGRGGKNQIIILVGGMEAHNICHPLLGDDHFQYGDHLWYDSESIYIAGIICSAGSL